jgi:hypothetical protein
MTEEIQQGQGAPPESPKDVVGQALDILRQLKAKGLGAADVRNTLPAGARFPNMATWVNKVWGPANYANSKAKIKEELATLMLPTLIKLSQNGHELTKPEKIYELYDAVADEKQKVEEYKANVMIWKVERDAYLAQCKAELEAWTIKIQEAKAERDKLRSSWILRFWDRVFYREVKPPKSKPFGKPAPVLAKFKARKDVVRTMILSGDGIGWGVMLHEQADKDVMRKEDKAPPGDVFRLFAKLIPTAVVQQAKDGTYTAFRPEENQGQTPKTLFMGIERPAATHLITGGAWLRQLIGYGIMFLFIGGEFVLIYLLVNQVLKVAAGGTP